MEVQLKINSFMKSIFLISIFFLNFCSAQHKIEKPPRPKKELENIKPTHNIQKGHLILSLGKLNQNEDDLYCWDMDGKCNIIDGKITLYNSSIAKGDNASVTERLYAEGEFLEGKYQGIWKYYNEKGKVIKREKWDNGKLIYRKEFK
ncbi:hypothetical protein L1276_000597 [Flavobacterium sp. HSC-32F16]|uniref:hypothetical protein n=1 Tax=Flavobacterium sp. HSC-32F16 TaxID=2910964 RepID=UPI0020A48B0A|nr:hypothetical protein [Flavobacterium sp. HSC-32F16]MCP2025457.1 hypothetical protein [Flavobacterium sp. HSC-32F16]